MDKDKQIGAIWKKIGRSGNAYFTGNFKGTSFVAFYDPDPKNPKSPIISIYESEPYKKQETPKQSNDDFPF